MICYSCSETAAAIVARQVGPDDVTRDPFCARHRDDLLSLAGTRLVEDLTDDIEPGDDYTEVFR